MTTTQLNAVSESQWLSVCARSVEFARMAAHHGSAREAASHLSAKGKRKLTRMLAV